MENRTLSYTKKKRLLAFLACVLLIAVCLPLVSCTQEQNPDGSSAVSDTSSSDVSGKSAYTVNVRTAGGMALSEIDVYIYIDDDMQEFAKTDENGQASFSLPTNSNYSVVLSDVPKGYDVAERYSFGGNTADITLTSSLITGEELSTAALGLGDVMYDFTVTASDGTEIKLSDVLAEKKLVILNFWYTTCSWCLTEFPIMEEVYGEYADSVEIIALDPMENATAVAAFQQQMGLTFPMAACPSSWANTFGVSGYPTSVFIDRYGVICLVESGAITSKTPFLSAFEHFTADNYKQTLCSGGVADLVSQVKPTHTMDSSENISALINSGDIEVTYRPETEGDSAEYTWPFIAGEKLGKNALYASNVGVDDSFAILYADVTLKAGQAVGFDYLASSEAGCDVMYVIVNDDDVFQISGISETEAWKTCYPCVADEDGVYEIALCYYKDSDTSEGDDTVYITNMRAVDVEDIDTVTYLPRYAAKTENGLDYTYVDVVYNEKDGYYHVGTADGPLLLADLMGYTEFSQDLSVYQIVYDGKADKDGVSLYEREGLGMVDYFSYASNASINGLCTVNAELAEMLKQVAEVAGFDGTEDEWLKICKYYAVYGPAETQLADPIKGLATFSAFEATLGKNVETNYFYYDRAIIPRGLLAAFTPEKSGVYRFTSKSDYEEGIDAWIFDENGEQIYTYSYDEREYEDPNNCSIVYYMEAGKTYYINMAFWDMYQTGYIFYDVTYIGSSYDLFRLCSPGYFTYDSDETGSAMYDIIAGGIKPVLKDGFYYSEGGSLLYADFTNANNIFGRTIKEMIDMEAFDFSKSETDAEILSYLKQHDYDIEATDEYLHTLWGEDYEATAEVYQLEDVYEGIYHGKGEDLTEEIRTYLDKLDTSSHTERNGCVVVDERLAEILQMLMDKFTFEGVEHSWTKLCYYYDYLGA